MGGKVLLDTDDERLVAFAQAQTNTNTVICVPVGKCQKGIAVLKHFLIFL